MYLPRIADDTVVRQLSVSGAVLIEGPKWCGKTWTGRQASNSQLYMQDPDRHDGYVAAAETMPSILLEGEVPRLLDEWQTAPRLWDAVRFAVDQRGEAGQFILTGSAVPRDGATLHTGTGRIGRMTMRTMSLMESQESTAQVSLKKLFDGDHGGEPISTMTIPDYADAIVRGGWPAAVTRGDVGQLARNYVDAIVEQDVSAVDGVEKNPDRVRKLLRSLSRHVSSMATIRTIHSDMSSNDTDVSLSEKTIGLYLNALSRIFVIDNVPAWSPKIRSKWAIRTSDKRQFCDPSIAAGALRLSRDKLLTDFATFGFLFEALCFRDLRVYADASDGDVYHYRDASGFEVDAIVALRDGRWGAIEIKMGAAHVDEAAENLKKLAALVDDEHAPAPSFLMVLTGTDIGYRRDDGVWVVPLGALAA